MQKLNNILNFFNILDDKKYCIRYLKDKSPVWQVKKIENDKYKFTTFLYNKKHKHFYFSLKTTNTYFNTVEAVNEISNVLGSSKDELLKILNKKFFNKKKRVLYFNKNNIEFNFKGKLKILKLKKTAKVYNKTGENLIRKYFNKILLTKHPESYIKEEYTTRILKCRPDITVFEKDKITVYEIKSEKDSFTRLSKQIECFKKFANSIILIIDNKKIDEYLEKFNFDGIGLISFDKETKTFKEILKFKENITLKDKVELLWNKELDILLEHNPKFKKLYYHQKVYHIKKLLSLKEIDKKVNNILYSRFKNS